MYLWKLVVEFTLNTFLKHMDEEVTDRTTGSVVQFEQRSVYLNIKNRFKFVFTRFTYYCASSYFFILHSDTVEVSDVLFTDLE